MCSQQQHTTLFTFFCIIACQQLFSIIEYLHDKLSLHLHQSLYTRLILIKHLIIAFRHWTGNNQRSTCIVNQYGIHFIHNRIIMLALNQILRIDSHIITQIIETELIIGSEGNIRHISVTTLWRVGLMLIDTINRKAMKHI